MARRRRWRCSSGSPPMRCARGGSGFVILSSRKASAATPPSPRTPPPAPIACASCSTPRTAASAIRSSTAPTAARASRSFADVPYDRPLTTMARVSDVPRLPGRVHDPEDRRFHAQPNACPRLRPRVTLLGADGVASLARQPGGRRDSPGRGRGCRPGALCRRDPRGQGGRRLSPRVLTPTTRRWSRGCALESTARTSRSR